MITPGMRRRVLLGLPLLAATAAAGYAAVVRPPVVDLSWRERPGRVVFGEP